MNNCVFVYALLFEPVVRSRSILELVLPSSANDNCEWPLAVCWNCLFVSNQGAFNVLRVSGRSALMSFVEDGITFCRWLVKTWTCLSVFQSLISSVITRLIRKTYARGTHDCLPRRSRSRLTNQTTWERYVAIRCCCYTTHVLTMFSWSFFGAETRPIVRDLGPYRSLSCQPSSVPIQISWVALEPDA